MTDGPDTSERPNGARKRAANKSASPILTTDVLSSKSYSDLLSRLDIRSQQHTIIAYCFVGFSVILVGLSLWGLFFEGHLLINDLSPAELNSLLLEKYNTDSNEITAQLGNIDNQVEKLSNQLRRDFASPRRWTEDIQSTEEMPFVVGWFDLRDDKGIFVGPDALYWRDKNNHLTQPLANFHAMDVGASTPIDEPREVWVAGHGGQMAHFKEPDTWTVERIDGSTSDQDINSIYASSPKNVWVAGRGGLIAHYDGETWTKIKLNTSHHLTTIKFSQDGWGVAAGDGILLVKAPDSDDWKSEVPTENFDFSTVRILSISIDDRRPLSASQTIVLGGRSNQNAVMLVGKYETESLPKWEFAKLSDGPALNGLNGFAPIRYIERCGEAASLIAVGENGTVLASQTNGITWSDVKIDSKETSADETTLPTFYYALSDSTNTAIIGGAGGYIGSLNLASRPLKVVTERAYRTGESAIKKFVNSKSNYGAFGTKYLARAESKKSDLIYSLTHLAPKYLPDLVDQNPSASFNGMAAADAEELTNAWTILTSINQEIKKQHSKITKINDSKEEALKTNKLDGSQLLIWAIGVRAIAVIVVLLILRLFINLARFNFNFSAYYATKGDAIRAMVILPGSVKELGAWFTPTLLDDIGGGWLDAIGAGLKRNAKAGGE
jgi:photosystem II stability/assembly factor-like uncharacterized protein